MLVDVDVSLVDGTWGRLHNVRCNYYDKLAMVNFNQPAVRHVRLRGTFKTVQVAKALMPYFDIDVQRDAEKHLKVRRRSAIENLWGFCDIATKWYPPVMFVGL